MRSTDDTTVLSRCIGGAVEGSPARELVRVCENSRTVRTGEEIASTLCMAAWEESLAAILGGLVLMVGRRLEESFPAWLLLIDAAIPRKGDSCDLEEIKALPPA